MSEHATDSPQPSDSVSEQPPQERLPHSKCGVVSFRLAVLSIILSILYIIFAYIIGGLLRVDLDAHPLLIPLIVVWFFGSFFLMPFAALIFGIVGVRQPQTRKVFAVWGIIISIAFLGLTVGELIRSILFYTPCC